MPIEGLRLSAFGAVLHARGAQRLSYGRELVVTLAGCGMNLVCGVLTAWFSLHYVWVEGFVFAGAHILLCAFNLLPIPPLDGSSIIVPFLKGKALANYYRLQQYAMPILILVLYLLPMWTGIDVIGRYFDVTVYPLAEQLLNFAIAGI